MGHYQDFCRPVWKKGKLYSGFKVPFYSYSLYHEFSVKYCYKYEQLYKQSALNFLVHSWATTRISAGLYGKKISFVQYSKLFFYHKLL
jgi:hypothetical protein